MPRSCPGGRGRGPSAARQDRAALSPTSRRSASRRLRSGRAALVRRNRSEPSRLFPAASRHGRLRPWAGREARDRAVSGGTGRSVSPVTNRGSSGREVRTPIAHGNGDPGRTRCRGTDGSGPAGRGLPAWGRGDEVGRSGHPTPAGARRPKRGPKGEGGREETCRAACRAGAPLGCWRTKRSCPRAGPVPEGRSRAERANEPLGASGQRPAERPGGRAANSSPPWRHPAFVRPLQERPRCPARRRGVASRSSRQGADPVEPRWRRAPHRGERRATGGVLRTTHAAPSHGRLHRQRPETTAP